MVSFRRSKARIAGAVLAFALCPAIAAPSLGSEQKASQDPQAAADGPEARPENSPALIVASWGGAYGQAQERAFIDDLRKDRGQAIDVVAHGGDPDIISRRLAADPAPWDVVDLSSETLEAACGAGLLERLVPAQLVTTADGASAREDYLPDGLRACGAASVAWSAVLVHGFDEVADAVPGKAADLLDIGRFPGKRALPKSPQYTFELALLADGVAPQDVYRTLETEEGLERALAALERIRPHIVWWQNAQEPLDLVAKGGAVLALAFNGRAFTAIVRDRLPISFLWDAQIYDVNYWAIPTNARHKDAALAFVALATSPERLAATARWIPYGPMRKSALALVGTHAEVDEDMSAYLPSTDGRLEASLRFDGAWWRRHEGSVRQAFRDWMERPPTPVFDPEIAPEE